MKNIPIESLLNMLAERSNIRWDEVTELSRFEAGLDTKEVSRTCYSQNEKETMAKAMTFLQGEGYVLSQDRWRIRGLMFSKSNTQVDHIVAYASIDVIGATDNTVNMSAAGDPETVDRLNAWFKETFQVKGSVIATASEKTNQNRIMFDKTFIPEGSAKLARQSFYPWLNISLDDYYKAFMEADEPLLVMFGPPGTAKSTFLRSMIASSNYNAYLAYHKEVVESPQLIRQFYQSPHVRILGYEDIDKHLARRESDNALMPSFLNAADGVVQHPGKKIVIITNLASIDRIDEALLRQGRCFDILKFELLSPEEAAAVRVDMNLPPMDFSSKKGWTVAEAISKTTTAQQVVNRFGRKIGF